MYVGYIDGSIIRIRVFVNMFHDYKCTLMKMYFYIAKKVYDIYTGWF